MNREEEEGGGGATLSPSVSQLLCPPLPELGPAHPPPFAAPPRGTRRKSKDKAGFFFVTGSPGTASRRRLVRGDGVGITSAPRPLARASV